MHILFYLGTDYTDCTDKLVLTSTKRTVLIRVIRALKTLVTIYLLTLSLCHPERSEGSREHKVGVTEILPPYGRLNDTFVSTSISYLI